nr:MAG: capsid protein [ssDNA virus sp.]
MAYGNRRGFKSRRSSSFAMRYRRRRATFSRTTRYSSRRPAKPRFAMMGYTRDMETKYHDRAIKGVTAIMDPIKDIGSPSNLGPPAGWSTDSHGWSQIMLGVPGSALVEPEFHNRAGNLLTGIKCGTLMNERVGNLIDVKWMKIRCTFNAAAAFIGEEENNKNDMNGEKILTGTQPYSDGVNSMVRTTVRMIVVQDTQVNSSDAYVWWNHVMEGWDSSQDGNYTSGMGSVHSEPRMAMMGRFKILSDRTLELDATKPQKTVTVMLRNIGKVRYAAPGPESYVSKGIWVIYSAMVGGNSAFIEEIPPAIRFFPPVLSRRVAYKDG